MDKQQALYLRYLFLHPHCSEEELQKYLDVTKRKNRECLRRLYHKKLIQLNEEAEISLTALGETYVMPLRSSFLER